MPYVTVEVDVDLDEVDYDELINEVCRRVEKKRKLTDPMRKLLVVAVRDLSTELGISMPISVPSSSLDDQMKVEHLNRVWDKYTSAQLEALLP